MGSEQQAMFTQLQSSLTNIKFEGDRSKFDFVAALANFYHTLHQLVVSEITFCRNPAGPSYMNLIHLRLKNGT